MVFAGDREAYEQAQKGGWLQNFSRKLLLQQHARLRKLSRRPSPLTPTPLPTTCSASWSSRLTQRAGRCSQAKPYLTRLYTTLSADEMTLDPMFSYNPDLPEVSNVHAADAYWDCADPETTPLEEWELVVTLADDREFRTLPFTAFGDPRSLARRRSRPPQSSSS